MLGGRNPFMHKAAEAIGDVLEPHLDSLNWVNSVEILKTKKSLKHNTRPMADAGIVSVVSIGLCIFLVQWAGGKVLDEIYEEKLKDPLFNTLQSALKKMGLSSDQRLEYQHIVSFDDIDTTIVIRLLLNDEEELKVSLDQLKYAHNLANKWLEQDDRKPPLICYEIQDGKCTLEPILYDSLEDIRKVERDKVIRKIMGDRKI